MLEALWEFICAVVSAIADAVMKALSFLFEIIKGIIMAILKPIADWINDIGISWAKSMFYSLDLAKAHYKETGVVSNEVMADLQHKLALTDILLPLVVVLGIVSAIITPFLAVFSGLVNILISLVLAIFVAAIASKGLDLVSPGSSSPVSLFESLLKSMGVTHNTPDYFLLAYTVIMGFIDIGAIAAGYIEYKQGKGSIAFVGAIIALTFTIVSIFGFVFAKTWADHNIKWAQSDFVRKDWEEKKRTAEVLLMFVAYVGACIGGIVIAGSYMKDMIASVILGGVAFALGLVNIFVIGGDLGWWGGIHLG
jgi:hypothetical protein